MVLFNPPHHHLLLLPLLPLLHNAIATPAPAGPSTNTTTPPPSTPNFSLGAKIPFPSSPPFPLLTMLFLTCEGLFTFAPYPYTSASPSGIKQSGTLAIQIEGSPNLPASAFQIRHALWALWLGAVMQLDERDYRPGIFVMDVKSGAASRSVGSIVYRNDKAGVGGVGNGTVVDESDVDGDGVGAIAPLDAEEGGPQGVTSRRRRRRIVRHAPSPQNIAITTTTTNRWSWPSLIPTTTTTNLSFPGFFPPNNTTTPPVSASTIPPFYNIQITSTSAVRISLTAVFTTVFETMVERASLPDREVLVDEWLYTSQRSGYVFGIRPPEPKAKAKAKAEKAKAKAAGENAEAEVEVAGESTEAAGESPPFEAMMGAMANLPRALQSGRYSVEVTFDVLDGETGAVVLQGFLVGDK